MVSGHRWDAYDTFGAGLWPGRVGSQPQTSGHGRRFMVSIGEEDLVAFAGIFGSETIQGTATFIQDVQGVGDKREINHRPECPRRAPSFFPEPLGS